MEPTIYKIREISFWNKKWKSIFGDGYGYLRVEVGGH